MAWSSPTDGGGAPEEIMLGDRFMHVVALAWALMFGLAL